MSSSPLIVLSLLVIHFTSHALCLTPKFPNSNNSQSLDFMFTSAVDSPADARRTTSPTLRPPTPVTLGATNTTQSSAVQHHSHSSPLSLVDVETLSPPVDDMSVSGSAMADAFHSLIPSNTPIADTSLVFQSLLHSVQNTSDSNAARGKHGNDIFSNHANKTVIANSSHDNGTDDNHSNHSNSAIADHTSHAPTTTASTHLTPEVDVTDLDDGREYNDENDDESTVGVKQGEICPTDCVCIDYSVDCNNGMLEYFPSAIPTTVHKLNLMDNLIQRVGPDNLRNLTQISEIYFSGNSEIHIENDSFIHNTKLKSIHLADCYQNLNIPRLHFGNASQISLNINSNAISSTYRSLLSFYRNLYHIDLSSNDITHLSNPLTSGRQKFKVTAAFCKHPAFNVSVASLKHLDLSYNSIRTISQCAFYGFSDLLNLDISHNSLERLNSLTFNGLTSLRHLKLQANQIHTVDAAAFYHLSSILSLNLNSNQLRFVSGGWLYGLSSLHTLLLSGNRVRTLCEEGASCYHSMSALRVLRVAHNQLSAVARSTLDGLHNLRHLDLSHNRIRHIDTRAIDVCERLAVLDLASNRLAQFIERSQSPLLTECAGALEDLSLRNNSLAAISDAVLHGMRRLVNLDLEDNQLVLLPRVDQLLPRLQLLQANTRRLVCDCELLRWLLVWVARHTHTRTFVDALRCHLPARLRAKSVLQLSDQMVATSARLNPTNSTTTTTAALDTAETADNVSQSTFDWIDATCGSAQASTQTLPALRARILRHPRASRFTVGETLRLTCQFTVSALAANWRVLWRRVLTPQQSAYLSPSLEISAADSASGRMRVTDTARVMAGNGSRVAVVSTLTCRNVSRAEEGHYQCVIVDSFGSRLSNLAHVIVNVAPYFVTRPLDVSVRRGHTARLECAAGGHPQPQITWHKASPGKQPRSVPPPEGVAIAAVSEGRLEYSGLHNHFDIVNAQWRDVGVYVCVANNTAGRVTANATISLLEAPKLLDPQTATHRHVSVSAGHMLLVNCLYDTQLAPSATVEWYRDGQRLNSSAPGLSMLASQQVLLILSAHSQDSGLYHCDVTNQAGTTTSYIHVSIYTAGLSSLIHNQTVLVIGLALLFLLLVTSFIWLLMLLNGCCGHRRRSHKQYQQVGGASHTHQQPPLPPDGSTNHYLTLPTEQKPPGTLLTPPGECFAHNHVRPALVTQPHRVAGDCYLGSASMSASQGSIDRGLITLSEAAYPCRERLELRLVEEAPGGGGSPAPDSGQGSGHGDEEYEDEEIEQAEQHLEMSDEVCSTRSQVPARAHSQQLRRPLLTTFQTLPHGCGAGRDSSRNSSGRQGREKRSLQGHVPHYLREPLTATQEEVDTVSVGRPLTDLHYC